MAKIIITGNGHHASTTQYIFFILPCRHLFVCIIHSSFSLSIFLGQQKAQFFLVSKRLLQLGEMSAKLRVAQGVSRVRSQFAPYFIALGTLATVILWCLMDRAQHAAKKWADKPPMSLLSAEHAASDSSLCRIALTSSCESPRNDAVQSFTNVYRSAAWGSSESSHTLSGSGSTTKGAFETITQFEPKFWELNITSIADVPSGDCGWQFALTTINSAQAYFGGDITPHVADENAQYTTFALVFVPRGDVEFSYRFAEAVYSGSIPVLVADDWVPPFSRLDNVNNSIAVQFEEYGLELAEDVALDTVVPALKGVQAHRLESMRRKARETCERHVQHVEVSITRWSAWLMVTEAVAMVRLAELLQEGFCTKNKTKSRIGPALTIQKPMCVHSMPMAVLQSLFIFGG